jgi:hypothetical protein
MERAKKCLSTQIANGFFWHAVLAQAKPKQPVSGRQVVGSQFFKIVTCGAVGAPQDEDGIGHGETPPFLPLRRELHAWRGRRDSQAFRIDLLLFAAYILSMTSESTRWERHPL